MLKSSVCLIAALTLTTSAARAAPECKELRQFQRDEGKGQRKYVDIFNFRKNHRGDTVLMLFKDTIEKGQPPRQWLFLHRPTEDNGPFCVVGRGEGFGHFEDHPETLYHGDFGEGHPSCATTAGKIRAPEALRAYANRTLGDDTIVLSAEGLEGPGFQFAIGTDHDWIIIQDNDDKPQTSCLYDSGSDVLMRFNITVPVD